MRGSVRWFNETKGYGFISRDDSQGDVFVHVSAVQAAGMQSLTDDQILDFDLEQDARSGKYKAGNLRLVAATNLQRGSDDPGW